ncbi:hypothetical protein ABW19_dt0205902 [Dactylella cylindrospora]|nr:hypothetical protein ABW19_dt0205902 [Dactylella cylindrospora]
MFAPPHQDLLEASQMFASGDHRLSFASVSSAASSSPPLLPQGHGGSNGSAGAVRRPPRKSTLTQQQKNQKRQRATQDQLITLEREFSKNPTPTAVVRDRIATEINMTERSVQIWFQNRRAKMKLIAKKSLESGEDVEIPESVRLYLANQNPDMKALAYGTNGGMNGYGGGFSAPGEAPTGKIVIHHFTCRSLNIGTWRRIGQNAMDLVVFYSPEKACITYYINNDSAGYKIEYPFRNIKSIELETLNVPMAPPNTHGGQMQGQLVIQLLKSPHFFMDTSGSGGFVQCGDFTEDQQATQVLTHTLGGNAKSLQTQLAKLLNLDVFQNRHRQPFMFDTTFASPPSPPMRPSSASGMMAPPSFVQQEARGHVIANPYRHKRQRSRSVPNINDFANFGPMPSFQFDDVIVEPENEDFFLGTSVSPKLKMEEGGSNNHLFAPAPQHPHALSNNLRIDTSAPGFLDYRPAYPLSAATTASVSEYAASPGLPGQLTGELAMTPGLHSPFIDQPWLSPGMVHANGLIPQSVSPLSALSNGDPIIASGSPPFLDRTGSAELFPLTHEQALYANDELTDMYAKQSLAIHQTPPALEDIDDVEQHLTPYNLSPMGQPISLSPEQSHAAPHPLPQA